MDERADTAERGTRDGAPRRRGIVRTLACVTVGAAAVLGGFQAGLWVSSRGGALVPATRAENPATFFARPETIEVVEYCRSLDAAKGLTRRELQRSSAFEFIRKHLATFLTSPKILLETRSRVLALAVWRAALLFGTEDQIVQAFNACIPCPGMPGEIVADLGGSLAF